MVDEGKLLQWTVAKRYSLHQLIRIGVQEGNHVRRTHGKNMTVMTVFYTFTLFKIVAEIGWLEPIMFQDICFDTISIAHGDLEIWRMHVHWHELLRKLALPEEQFTQCGWSNAVIAQSYQFLLAHDNHNFLIGAYSQSADALREHHVRQQDIQWWTICLENSSVKKKIKHNWNYFARRQVVVLCALNCSDLLSLLS